MIVYTPQVVYQCCQTHGPATHQGTDSSAPATPTLTERIRGLIFENMVSTGCKLALISAAPLGSFLIGRITELSSSQLLVVTSIGVLVTVIAVPRLIPQIHRPFRNRSSCPETYSTDNNPAPTPLIRENDQPTEIAEKRTKSVARYLFSAVTGAIVSPVTVLALRAFDLNTCFLISHPALAIGAGAAAGVALSYLSRTEGHPIITGVVKACACTIGIPLSGIALILMKEIGRGGSLFRGVPLCPRH